MALGSEHFSNEFAERKYTYLYLFVDLRMKQYGLHPFSLKSSVHSLHQDLKGDASAYFQSSREEICEIRWARQPHVPLLILGGNRDNLHLIINYNEHNIPGCLVIGRDASLSSGLSMCQQWLEEMSGSQHHAPRACLLRLGKRLDDPQAFSHLHDFEEVDLVRAATVMLKFLHRRSQCSEQAFYVECSGTDYVREAKESFLQAFAHEDHDEGAVGGIDHVWLTCGETVLPDDELLRNLWNPTVNQLAYSLESERTGADLTATDALHVHFQPPDAVLVKLNFKSDARRYAKSESVILMSPGADVQTLRHEISKVIHKDPNSFKMFIAGKKVEMNTMLEPFLEAPNCTVVVEQRAKIRLNMVCTTGCQSSDPSCFPVDMHRYERVEKLKQEVCSRLEVPGYSVDLHHKNNYLNELDDLRGSRLRSGDTVKALVLPNRICVSIRLRSSHWVDAVINDAHVTTVEDLKEFALAMLEERSSQCRPRQGSHATVGVQHSDPDCISTFSVILGGVLLSDSATLKEAGVEMNSRVVLVEEEKRCFTVAPPGRVPVYISSDKNNYQPPSRVMAMCDGKQFYFPSKFLLDFLLCVCFLFVF